jgi:16S rRNA (uracil1498-N3)-methyltransferase
VSRFYVPKECISGDRITVTGKEAHHISDVMRLKVSDPVTVFDGTGKEYTGIIKEISRKSISLEISATRTAVKSACDVTLIQAIPKKDKMDFIVQKATELGVCRIIPVVTQRTIPDWGKAKKDGVVERWKKIAQEAAKQCGRAYLPEIDAITSLKEIASPQKGLAMTDLKLIATLNDKTTSLKNVLKNVKPSKIAVAIGPEGDFIKEEVGLFEDNGFKAVGLGPMVLKSDTAGLAALAIINYEYQNW